LKNKERILDVATELFNQQGTGAISTNHIADAAGISPGNLYYHYRNKTEIIRAIFERVFALWDVQFSLPEDIPIDLVLIQNLVRTNFHIMYDHRFIYRELIALLKQDDVLHERFVRIRERGYSGFRELVAALALVGLARPMYEATVNRLADLIWLISEFWLASIEVSGQQVDEDQMQRGIDLMMEALRPYLLT
jgi:AcrR family transcriptional regulator